MEIPNLVRERLGNESVEATVSLGDEDFVCVTPTRTILYRGEGLLSDESVDVYSHDVERLDVSEGRRNTKFVLEYVDGTEQFKVPGDRTDTLLQILMQGILRVAGVTDDGESVAGVFRFSELTLVVTEARLVKHIGTPVWDDDFEVYDYADVTGLDFEEGSVATQIVVTVDGRPQRIKAPSDEAPQVEQTLTQTLCAYYDVGSLDELAGQLDDGAAEETPAEDAASGYELDDGISPLVGDEADDSQSASEAGADPTAGADDLSGAEEADAGATTPEQTAARSDAAEASARADGADADRQANANAAADATGRPDADVAADAGTDDAADIDPGDVAAIEDQLASLTEAVKRQNELLRRHDERIEAHDEKIDQLIEELRRGR